MFRNSLVVNRLKQCIKTIPISFIILIYKILIIIISKLSVIH